MNTELHLRDFFKEAWQHFTTRPWFFIGITLFYFILSSSFNSATEELTKNSLAIGSLFNLCSSLLELIVIVGYSSLILRSIGGEQPLFSDIFSKTSLVLKFIWTSFLFMLFCAFGTVAFIVPGIILFSAFFFAPVIVVDKNISGMAALKESMRITQGARAKILWFMLLIIVINILGAIFFGVGLLITYPVTIIAQTLLYKKLSQQSTHDQPLSILGISLTS